jgi:hypothetical protein
MQNWKCDELEKEESIRMDSKNAMRRCRKQIAHIEKN